MKLRKHHHLVEYMLSSRFKNPDATSFECFVIRDGICGIGKTTEAIENINQILMENLNNRVMYVGVYLPELHRIADTKINIKYKDQRPILKNGEPVYKSAAAKWREFHHPYNLYGKSKLNHLKKLIVQNKSVVITHKLFSSFDKEIINLLKSKKYHLIIDEEPSVIESIEDRFSVEYVGKDNESHDVYGFTLDQADLCKLESVGILSIDERNAKLKWKGPELLRYKDLYRDVNNNHIDFYKKEKESTKFFWRFNPEVFSCFKTAQLLTYLFKGSTFQMYLDINRIPYLIEDLTEASYYKLKKKKGGSVTQAIMPLHKLIFPYQPKGFRHTELKTPNGGPRILYTSGYFESFISNESLCKSSPIKTALGSFFKNNHPVTKKPPTVSQKMWTTLKKAKEALEDNGYKGSFVPFNTRATNDYKEATFLAYVYDPHPRPDIVQYVKEKGGKFDMKAYAISLLIQWVFRSAIRDGKPIVIFIASPRMQELFKDWLSQFKERYTFCENVRTAPEQALVTDLVPLQSITTDEFLKIQPGLIHIKKLPTLIRSLKGY